MKTKIPLLDLWARAETNEQMVSILRQAIEVLERGTKVMDLTCTGLQRGFCHLSETLDHSVEKEDTTTPP